MRQGTAYVRLYRKRSRSWIVLCNLANCRKNFIIHIQWFFNSQKNIKNITNAVICYTESFS